MTKRRSKKRIKKMKYRFGEEQISSDQSKTSNFIVEFLNDIPFISKNSKTYIINKMVPSIEKNFVNESRLTTFKQKFINWFIGSRIGQKMLTDEKWRIFLISKIK